MRQWTEQERQHQAKLIQQWQPWQKAGVKTEKGKAISKMNALKHGAYSAQVKAVRRVLSKMG